MRTPDRIETRDWNGHEVTIRVWQNPTDLPWDGDCELEPGSEGWDIDVEASITINGQCFNGHDSLGFNWGGGDYIREQTEEIVTLALATMAHEIRLIARGRDVATAKRAQSVAAAIVRDLDVVQGELFAVPL
jgi:hypothetical protein